MIEELHFASPIYFENKPEWVEKVDKACDKHLKKSLDSFSFQQEMEKRKKQYGEDFDKVKDFAWPNHSEMIAMDPEIEELRDYIVKNSHNILSNQGFDMSSFDMAITEFWVQEFPKGGYHDTHIHYNSHISGFYFLRCSERTAVPFFNDARIAKTMNDLPLKESDKVSMASSLIHYKPKPGTMIFFPAYLNHGFSVDAGVDDFRFIHFNLQAVRKLITNHLRNEGSTDK